MSWKPLVAGVDGSSEARRAATLACRLAEAAGTTCRLVHATPDPWADLAATQMTLDFEQLTRDLLTYEKQEMARHLAGCVRPETIEQLDVRLGRPGPTLIRAAADYQAEMIVVGGKHHATLARWFGGSSAHDLVRRSDVPLLITGPGANGIGKVLVSVDLSSAAGPTIEAAEKLAQLCGARMRALHVIEPVLSLATTAMPAWSEEYVERSERTLEEHIWPILNDRTAEVMVRRGSADATIAEVAVEWRADLVVVGSHGRGWVDRLLIGSTTERLLNRLPTSLLVVPVHSHTGGATFEQTMMAEGAL